MCMQKMICGIALNDIGKPKDKIGKKALFTWYCMIKRCYDKNHINYKYYKDCDVCKDWLVFSNFLEWFRENYIENYHLDKDILSKDKKIYSPETCCFIPQALNKLLVFHTNKKKNRKLPIGVGFDKQVNKYIGFGVYKERKLFLNVKDAYNYYKQNKEYHIKELARYYFENNKIPKRVFDALTNYKLKDFESYGKK